MSTTSTLADFPGQELLLLQPLFGLLALDSSLAALEFKDFVSQIDSKIQKISYLMVKQRASSS